MTAERAGIADVTHQDGGTTPWQPLGAAPINDAGGNPRSGKRVRRRRSTTAQQRASEVDQKLKRTRLSGPAAPLPGIAYQVLEYPKRDNNEFAFAGATQSQLDISPHVGVPPKPPTPVALEVPSKRQCVGAGSSMFRNPASTENRTATTPTQRAVQQMQRLVCWPLEECGSPDAGEVVEETTGAPAKDDDIIPEGDAATRAAEAIEYPGGARPCGKRRRGRLGDDPDKRPRCAGPDNCGGRSAGRGNRARKQDDVVRHDGGLECQPAQDAPLTKVAAGTASNTCAFEEYDENMPLAAVAMTAKPTRASERGTERQKGTTATKQAAKPPVVPNEQLPVNFGRDSQPMVQDVGIDHRIAVSAEAE